jgi:hypothetical protein
VTASLQVQAPGGPAETVPVVVATLALPNHYPHVILIPRPH